MTEEGSSSIAALEQKSSSSRIEKSKEGSRRGVSGGNNETDLKITKKKEWTVLGLNLVSHQ